MATDMIGGLFGPTPQEIQQAQYQQNAQNAAAMAGMNATQRGVMGMMQGGAGLVNTLAPALGYKNPAVEQARGRQEMMQNTDLNLEDPSSLRAAAMKMRQIDPQMAMRLGILANQREKEQSQMNLEAAQARKALRDNPNIAVEEIGVGDGMFQMALVDKTGQRDPQLIGTPYKGSRQGGGAGGTSRVENIYNPETGEHLNVPFLAANDYYAKGWLPAKYSTEIAGSLAGAKKAATDTGEFAAGVYVQAKEAEQALPKMDKVISEIKSAIQGGGAITGPMADVRLAMERAKLFFTNSKKAGKNVESTEFLNSLLGMDTFGAISSLGIGARGMDTPAEREFLREVLSGRIELTPQALLRMAELRREGMEKKIGRYDDMVESGEYKKLSGREGTRIRPAKTATRRVFDPATRTWKEQ